jgi:hypothetical protein
VGLGLLDCPIFGMVLAVHFVLRKSMLRTDFVGVIIVRIKI